MSTTATFYTVAGDSGATQYFDEDVARTTVDQTWAAIIAGALNGGSRTSAGIKIGFDASGTNNQWATISRGSLRFPTISIPATSTILSAILYLYGYQKWDNCVVTPDINIYAISRDNNYTYGGALSSVISYNAFSITGYNAFVLNAAGLAEIVKAGTTYLGIRNANYDVAAIAPSWVNSATSAIYCWTADYVSHPEYCPKLVVTYTTNPVVNLVTTGLRHIYNRNIYNLEITFGGVSVTEPIVQDELVKMAEEAVGTYDRTEDRLNIIAPVYKPPSVRQILGLDPYNPPPLKNAKQTGVPPIPESMRKGVLPVTHPVIPSKPAVPKRRS